jgi:hypothetical protein
LRIAKLNVCEGSGKRQQVAYPNSNGPFTSMSSANSMRRFEAMIRLKDQLGMSLDGSALAM